MIGPMSNSNRLLVLALLLLGTGGAFLLLGPSASSFPVVAAIALGGLLAGVASLVLRGREPRAERTESEPEPVNLRGPVWLIGLAVGTALALAALLTGLLVAVGEAQGHVFFHLVFGMVALGLYVGLGFAARARPSTASLWRALQILVWFALAGSFLEAIGGAGYDRFNAETRIGWLTTLHGFASPFAAVWFPAVPIAVLALLVALAGRLRTR
jgi:hypothetical protein